jgi:hypothetical protein
MSRSTCGMTRAPMHDINGEVRLEFLTATPTQPLECASVARRPSGASV